MATLSDLATTRAMARNAAGDATLVDLKAVGPDWPTLGAVELNPPLAVAAALEKRDGRFGVLVDDALLDKLQVKVGDRVSIGESEFDIRARLVSEPDRLGTGIGFGARALISLEALRGKRARAAGRADSLDDPRDDGKPASAAGAMRRSKPSSRRRKRNFPRRAGRRARAALSRPTFRARSTGSASFWRWSG